MITSSLKHFLHTAQKIYKMTAKVLDHVVMATSTIQNTANIFFATHAAITWKSYWSFNWKIEVRLWRNFIGTFCSFSMVHDIKTLHWHVCLGEARKLALKGALPSKKDLDWYPTGVRYTAWSCSKADKYTIQALMRWGTLDNECFAMRSIKIQS